MGSIVDQINRAFRDFVTEGVSSSGLYDVDKSEVREVGPLIEAAIGGASLGSMLSVTHATRALLDADLAHAADSVALVYGDATDANNDLYKKVGASGTGSWTLTNAFHSIIAALAQPVADAADVSRQRASNAVPFMTWTGLASSTAMAAGDRATVSATDTGTHTDPVVGGTVNNAGVYQYSASPAGWQRVDDLDSTKATAGAYIVTWPVGASAATIKTAIQNAVTANPGKRIIIAMSGTTNTGISLPDDTEIGWPAFVTITEAAAQGNPLFYNAGAPTSAANTGIKIDIQGHLVGNNASKSLAGRTGVIGTIALLGVSNGHCRIAKTATCQRPVQWYGADFAIDIGINTAGLAVTVNGGSSRFKVRVHDHQPNVAAVSLAANDASAYTAQLGDIADFEISAVHVSASGGGHVQLLSGTTGGTLYSIKRGKIENLTGTAGGAAAVLISAALTGGGSQGVGLVDLVEVEADCALTNSQNLVRVANVVGNMSVKFAPNGGAADYVKVETTGSVTGRIVVNACGALAGNSRPVYTQGSIDTVELTGSLTWPDAASDAAAPITIGPNATAWINNVILTDYTQILGGSGLYKQSGSAAVAPKVFASNTRIAGARRAFFVIGAGADIRTSNCDFSGLTVNFVRADAAAITLRDVATTITYSGGTESTLVNGATLTRPAIGYAGGGGGGSGGELVITNPADALTEIQAALDTANTNGGGRVRLYQPGTMVLDGCMVTYSNVWLDIGPATILQKATGVTGNPSMIRNATMPSPTAYTGPVDTNIKVTGGIWDPNYAGGVTSSCNNSGTGLGAIPAGCTGNMLFFGVRGLTVENIIVKSGSSAMFQAIGERIVFRNIQVNGGEEYKFDFVHINGPSRWVDIDNIRGWTHDDLVAINAWDWVRAGPTVGDITDVNISRIAMLAPEVNTNTQGAIRLLSGSRTVGGVTSVGNVARVVIDTIEGMASGGNGVIGTDPTPDPNDPGGASPNVPTGGTISDVTIKNHNRVRLFNSTPGVRIAQTCINWTIDGMKLHPSNLGSGIRVLATGSIDRLSVSNYVGDAAGGVESYLHCMGTIGKLTLRGCRWIGGNSGGVTSGSSTQGFVYVGGASAWIDEISVSDQKQNFGECFLYVENTAIGGTCRITFDGSRFDNVKHALWLRKGAFKVRAVATDWANTPNDIARLDGAVTFDLTESACDFSGAGTPYTNVGASASIRHDGTSFAVATGVITAPVNGDMVRTATGRSMYKSGAWAAL